jgi:ADP-ribosylglycohydrolase
MDGRLKHSMGHLKEELRQRRESGYDVGGAAALLEQIAAARLTEARYEAMWQVFEALPEPEDFAYEEPSALAEIRALRPDGPREMAVTVDENALFDRIYGAWLGRCAGCNLGKPVEGWRRERIAAYLEAADAYPLDDYFPVINPFPEGLALNKCWPETTRSNIEYMARDDDTDYTILGLHILEKYGRDFRPDDVIQTWLEMMPVGQTYTAEIIAYRNYVMGMEPPRTATYRNPYREWIGAQIRADAWGYVNPGKPKLAAEYAWRDASISHMANGIYGEMWASAAIAAALVMDDVHDVIDVALSEIPANCRLAEAVQDAVEAVEQYAAWEDAWDAVMPKYADMHGVHVLNNTVFIVFGLLYGADDLGKSISTAVMCGLDTDCTGATVGSIVGALNGADALPDTWVGPLNDTIRSAVFGYDHSVISDLARRTLKIASD